MDITSVVQANMSKKDRRRQLSPLEEAQAKARAQANDANRAFYFNPPPTWQDQDINGTGPRLRSDLPQVPDSMRYHGAPVPNWDR